MISREGDCHRRTHSSKNAERSVEQQDRSSCLKPRQIGPIEVDLLGELALGQAAFGSDPSNGAAEVGWSANDPARILRSFGFDISTLADSSKLC